ncbi:MAG: PAP/fibrillin family protein [Synechococcales bacterium]|nr:PAP/fibrillin family protein [Synechococcales bacterium]
MLYKSELMEKLAASDRGLAVTSAQRTEIAMTIARLEDQNPTPRPTEAVERLEGDWQLLYTTSRGILGLDRIPFNHLGAVYQSIRLPADTSYPRLYNVAEISGIPGLAGLVAVSATCVPVSPLRVSVRFDRSIAGLQRVIGYRSVQGFIQQIEAGQKFLGLDWAIAPRNQNGWLEITYLDDDLRVGRGSEGSVFVLSRVG